MSWSIKPTSGVDSYIVTDGRAVVGPFTKGHAESVAESMNARDLRMALSFSRQIKVPTEVLA